MELAARTTSLRLSGWASRSWVMALCVGFGVLHFAAALLGRSRAECAWDYAINWTAANALLRRISLYDLAAMRGLAQEVVGGEMTRAFGDPFGSFIGLPTTALLYVPFTAWAFQDSLLTYRAVALLTFGTAIWIASLALPTKEARHVALLCGAPAFLFSNESVSSIQPGQADAWVMLGLSVALAATAKRRWWIVGAGFGAAALLKISPAIILFYLLLRGKWQAVVSAAVTSLTALSAAVLLGRRGDLLVFLADVAPRLANGTLAIQNQSLAAWIGRMLSPETDLLTAPATTLGAFRWIGLVVAAGSATLLWRTRRGQPPEAVEIGFLIFAALLAGPLTWDHYTTWLFVGA